MSLIELFKTLKDCWNKCSYCGKFISIKDFSDGVASRHLSHDWDYSREEVLEVYENKCKRCILK